MLEALVLAANDKIARLTEENHRLRLAFAKLTGRFANHKESHRSLRRRVNALDDAHGSRLRKLEARADARLDESNAFRLANAEAALAALTDEQGKAKRDVFS
jgi:hypothetical protein